MICDRFCTVNCVNGSCSIALGEEYEERGMPVVYSCNECVYHTSCDDCDWQVLICVINTLMTVQNYQEVYYGNRSR